MDRYATVPIDIIDRMHKKIRLARVRVRVSLAIFLFYFLVESPA